MWSCQLIGCYARAMNGGRGERQEGRGQIGELRGQMGGKCGRSWGVGLAEEMWGDTI